MKKPESICVFGDSTAWGAWDLEKGGWVNRLWFYLGIRDEDYTELYNCSISGGTSKTILDRFESEAKIRNADALIFQTGGNDASRDSSGKVLVEMEEFERNIKRVIERARKITDKIIFLDLRNCDESKTTPVGWVDYWYTNESMKEYGETMERACGEENVLFMPMPKIEDDEFEDGLHPNAKGHEKIFVAVKDFLEKHNWI